MEPLDQENNYSIVLTNLTDVFSPMTFQNRVYDLNANGSFKKIRTGQCTGSYATEAMYTSVQGIRHRPTLSWSTPNNIYSNMSVAQRSPLNALKAFLNDHPCMVSWHNGNSDDMCKINGFHMHVVVQKSTLLWHDHAWRAVRQKLQNAGIIVRCQKVNNLPGLLSHLQERPRFLVGCNNAEMCRVLIADTPSAMSDQELRHVFIEDHDVSDGRAESGQVEFFQAMTGWTDRSSVGSTLVSPTTTSEFNISSFLLGGPSEPFKTTSPFGKMVADKVDGGEQPCASTRTSKKVTVCQDLMSKYHTHDPSGLLAAILDGEDGDDLQTFRVLRTTPQFTVIWDQAVMEIQAVQRKAGVTYADRLMTATLPCDLNTMTVSDTSLFWEEWCTFQGIDPAMILIELYAVLSLAYPKRNCFAFIGDSDAGKTYWMGAIACLTDQRGDTITSGDFMWQECIDKALIYIPELALTKADQVESFKKVCEGQSTNINVKNKRAAVLNRTLVLLTSNSVPWSFFTNEEVPIRNRMFMHTVRAFHGWQPGQGSPNVRFFVDMFTLIMSMVATDNSWPYDLDGEDVQVLLDIVQAMLNKIGKGAEKPFVLKPPYYPQDQSIHFDEKWALCSITDATLVELEAQSATELCMSLRYFLTVNCRTPYFKLLPGTDGVAYVPHGWAALQTTNSPAFRLRVKRVTIVLHRLTQAVAKFPNVWTNDSDAQYQFHVKRFLGDMVKGMEEGTLYTYAQHTLTAKRTSRIPIPCARIPVTVPDVPEPDVVDSPDTPVIFPPNKTVKGKKMETACFGCANDCGGQADHMGTGGCLEVTRDQELLVGIAGSDDEPDCFTIGDLDCTTLITGSKSKKVKHQ